MKLKHVFLAAALALTPLASAGPSSSAVVVAVGVGHPGHYCWRHRCWHYRWHGGYYNYYWHGRYWRERWMCHRHWCYR